MAYYNNPKFESEILRIGEEYTKKVNNAKNRKERVRLALIYHELLIKASNRFKIYLECTEQPNTSFVNEILFLAKKFNYNHILDYGSAEGKLLNALHKKNSSHKYFGSDFDIYNKAEGYTFLKYDSSYLLPKKYKFDLVISHHVVEHISPFDLKTHLSEIREHLNEGGAYFMNLPSKDCGDFWDTSVVDHFHIGQYDYTNLVKALENSGYKKIQSLLFNPNYFLPLINPIVSPKINSSLKIIKNKYIYAMFNLLTLRLIAFK